MLEACFLICEFFYEQKLANDEAKENLGELADFVRRLLPSLRQVNRSRLESANLHLNHLWGCLRECKRIYEKWKDGWKLTKPWVTPKQILAKAKEQEMRTRNAWQDLSTIVVIDIHNKLEFQPSAPASAESMADDTWEILPPNSVKIEVRGNGVPSTRLGQGSSGVVGRGTFIGGDGKVVPVAVKMKMANLLAAAEQNPQIVKTFRREVRLLATIDHPNIVECYGGVTRKDGYYVMWIVMELLDFTLFVAITEKHLQIGRDKPRTYVNLVTGICNALDYLHTPVGGNPIVHRDLKPDNIMINGLENPVAKLIDFDMAKETKAGVGSTMSKEGTKIYWAPEIDQNGGCSVASDMWAFALVALFLWWGLTPDQNPDRGKIEETADLKANFTQELMLQCLNEDPRGRPAAAFVSFRLDSFVAPSPDPPSGDLFYFFIFRFICIYITTMIGTRRASI